MSIRRVRPESRESSYYKANDLSSVSTQGNSPPRESIKSFKKQNNKEKLQLCRKFMEKGACPYNYKCKFAHGSHQLRRNQQANFRYKTKECGTFFKQGSCSYGDRCNFLHTKKIKEIECQKRLQMWQNFSDILLDLGKTSRLKSILSKTQ